MRLNKFLSQAGIASRRESDNLIKKAMVTVNGVLETNPAYQVKSKDEVFFDDQRIKLETKSRIIAFNKPEGYITTMKDPHKRKTVIDLIHTDERLFPIGRLDKDTTGLLLLTNDGQLANKLMHPSSQIEREYAVRVLGQVTKDNTRNLLKGVQLEDGFARFTDIVDSGGTGANHWYHVVVMEGRNKEVRRLWESQGVQVTRLIRTRFGSYILPRKKKAGQFWRLDEKEIKLLQDSVLS